jgi:hypothetical protein
VAVETADIDAELEGNALADALTLAEPVTLADALTDAVPVTLALGLGLVVSVATTVATAEVVTVFENEIDGVFDGVTDADPLAETEGVGLRVAGAD